MLKSLQQLAEQLQQLALSITNHEQSQLIADIADQLNRLDNLNKVAVKANYNLKESSVTNIESHKSLAIELLLKYQDILQLPKSQLQIKQKKRWSEQVENCCISYLAAVDSADVIPFRKQA